jgi:flagellar basal-body rod protein FlgC
MDAFEISASAMTAQRLRLDIISSNLANINTTRKADGTVGAYRRRNVVFAPILDQQMAAAQKQGQGSTSSQGSISYENGVPTLKATVSNNPPPAASAGVRVVEVAEDTETPLKMVYDPSHPDADENGYVSMPNINPVTEMVDMLTASRAYEANVSALQATKALGKAALEI